MWVNLLSEMRPLCFGPLFLRVGALRQNIHEELQLTILARNLSGTKLLGCMTSLQTWTERGLLLDQCLWCLLLETFRLRLPPL